ncbi:amino acid adenylation domain-containing protein, partial [Actinomadura sp. KC216]|uniref:non-ribosomal peptide synthetase n=1 Tax=Actinomadura sp. KC216 TaxID=2530370 RepID=UPI00104FF631
LPLAVPPEQVDRPVFTRRHHLLTHERWACLTDAARARGLTSTSVLLAAYAEVLRTWSKRQECTVTVSVLDRRPLHPRVDELVGNFLAPNLLAVDSTAEQPFAERAAALQRRLRTDMAHTAFGGVRVLRELTRHRGDGRGVSMPVVFTSTLDGATGPAWGGFGDPVHVAGQTAQIWLENQVFAEDGGVSVTWNAVEELFPAGSLDAMFQAYRTLLDRLIDDPGIWDRTGGVVPLPADQLAERRRANATAADIPPRLLHELVAEAADRTPDAVAVIADGTEVTYRRITEDAHRLAHRLPGCEPDELVAVSMRPGAAQISAILGVLHAGAAYVAIDPELPEERRHRLLRRCHARALVTEPDLRAAWPRDVQVMTFDEQETRDQPAHRPKNRRSHDDLAYVIFTSGSTGTPKGVAITHRSAANTVQDINRRFAVTARDKVLALAPTNFDLSVYDIFGVLGAGGTVVIPSPERSGDPGHWTDLVDRHGVTIWNSVPAPMRMWAESLTPETAHRGDTLRLALLSGDWIPVDLPGQVRALLPEVRLISLGGATEGSIWSVHHPIGHVPPEWTSIPYGKPLANQTLHVYNTWLEPCPVGVTGEIHIGGTGVAQGYWEDPDRTAERFIVHPNTGERLYRTGDLGRYLPGGDIEILGREDFQVKINGYRVELGEIEAALARLPGVRQVMVTAPAHPGSGQRQLTAYVVADEADPVALRAELRNVLPNYMVPMHYLRLDALPLTTNGKIDRAALPLPWTDDPPEAGHAAPSNRVEERLLKIWGEQLGHDDFGTEDGFFDVGGDSLHAMGIITRLRDEFGIDTGTEDEVVEALFLNATIASFAEIIAEPAP